jgi:hypothetical protein
MHTPRAQLNFNVIRVMSAAESVTTISHWQRLRDLLLV